MEDESYLQKAEEIIMKHSSRSIRLLILALTLMIAPLIALSEEIPCDHMRDSYTIKSLEKYPSSTEKHIIVRSVLSYCNDCHQSINETIFDMQEEDHFFDGFGRCINCGFILRDNGYHVCEDINHEKCVFTILYVEYISPQTHYGITKDEHYCTDCGYFMGSDTYAIYQNHFFDENGSCLDCGYCPHLATERVTAERIISNITADSHTIQEVFDLVCVYCGENVGQETGDALPLPHSFDNQPIAGGSVTLTDNQDGKTHQHTYTVRQVCADCGYEAGETTICLAAQTHAFAVTPSLLSDESGHWERKTRQCACGFIGYTTDEKEEGLITPHSFKDGICTECQYACRHAYENEICTLCGVKMMHTYILKLAAEGEIQPDGSILYLIGADQQVEIILHCVETDTDHLLSEFMAFSIASPDQSMHYMPSRTENGKASLKSGAAQGVLALMDKRTGEKIHTIYFVLQ